MRESTTGRVFRWEDLPSKTLFEGHMKRAAFRSDEALLMFDWVTPGMKRWEPHAHPFDQIVLTLAGRQLLEIEGEAFEMGPGTIARVPANLKHTGWIVGDEPLLNIDIFAPPRGDYLTMVDYQPEYVADNERRRRAAPVFAQNPSQASFTGRMMADTTSYLARWSDLPTIDLEEGNMRRGAFRGDSCLISFNWIKPSKIRTEPHRHPFDQIVLTLSGTQMLEVEGRAMECGPGTLVRVPSDAWHTGWAVGDEPILNVDVFAPAREDYLFLTKDQKGF